MRFVRFRERVQTCLTSEPGDAESHDARGGPALAPAMGTWDSALWLLDSKLESSIVACGAAISACFGSSKRMMFRLMETSFF